MLIAAALAAATLGTWFVLAPLPSAARLATTLIAVPLPALAYGQARALARMEIAALPRNAVYLSSGVTLWLLALGALLAARASGFTPSMLGLRPLPANLHIAWIVFGIAAAALLLAAGKVLGVRESPVLVHLLPVSWTERAVFTVLAVTAGITEEIVFRGFLIASLTFVTRSGWAAAALAAVVFGAVHSYQARAGVARTALLGFVLSVPLLVSGSILPGMIAHATIDVAAGVLLGRRLTEPVAAGGRQWLN